MAVNPLTVPFGPSLLAKLYPAWKYFDDLKRRNMGILTGWGNPPVDIDIRSRAHDKDLPEMNTLAWMGRRWIGQRVMIKGDTKAGTVTENTQSGLIVIFDNGNEYVVPSRYLVILDENHPLHRSRPNKQLKYVIEKSSQAMAEAFEEGRRTGHVMGTTAETRMNVDLGNQSATVKTTTAQCECGAAKIGCKTHSSWCPMDQ